MDLFDLDSDDDGDLNPIGQRQNSPDINGLGNQTQMNNGNIVKIADLIGPIPTIPSDLSNIRHGSTFKVENPKQFSDIIFSNAATRLTDMYQRPKPALTVEQERLLASKKFSLEEFQYMENFREENSTKDMFSIKRIQPLKNWTTQQVVRMPLSKHINPSIKKEAQGFVQPVIRDLLSECDKASENLLTNKKLTVAELQLLGLRRGLGELLIACNEFARTLRPLFSLIVDNEKDVEQEAFQKILIFLRAQINAANFVSQASENILVTSRLSQAKGDKFIIAKKVQIHQEVLKNASYAYPLKERKNRGIFYSDPALQARLDKLPFNTLQITREFFRDYALPVAVVVFSLVGSVLFGDVELKYFSYKN